MPFKWDTPPEQVFGNLADSYVDEIQFAITQLANRYAPEIESWMKSNAVWTDRTANARQTLAVDVETLAGDMVEIAMSYGVEYGKYLEFSHAGRYAIITPALDHFTPRIWRDVQGLFS